VRLALALLAAAVLHFALRAAHVWWVLATCQPLLLVEVAATRRFGPVAAGWFGLGCGLAIDVLGDRVVGPGAIAGAVAGVLVRVVVERFDLEGPLFWVSGAFLAGALFELTDALLMISLGAGSGQAWLGALATVATTGSGGLLIALVERLSRAWRSPERRRRRVLRRL
jgi:hypothetical protein